MQTAKDNQIRRLIGHYGTMPRLILEQRYFAGNAKALDNWLTRHTKSLQVIPNAIGNFSLYQLTRAATRELGFSDARSHSYGSRALVQRLAVLLFCEAYTGIRRRLMDAPQLERLTGTALKGTHVLEETFAQGGQSARKIGRIYRVMVPDSNAKITHTLKTIAATLDQVRLLTARNGAPFAPAEWLAERRYAFAILTETEGKQKAVKEAFRAAGLLEFTHLNVERLPSLEELARLRKEEDHVQIDDAA